MLRSSTITIPSTCSAAAATGHIADNTIVGDTPHTTGEPRRRRHRVERLLRSRATGTLSPTTASANVADGISNGTYNIDVVRQRHLRRLGRRLRRRSGRGQHPRVGKPHPQRRAQRHQLSAAERFAVVHRPEPARGLHGSAVQVQDDRSIRSSSTTPIVMWEQDDLLQRRPPPAIDRQNNLWVVGRGRADLQGFPVDCRRTGGPTSTTTVSIGAPAPRRSATAASVYPTLAGLAAASGLEANARRRSIEASCFTTLNLRDDRRRCTGAGAARALRKAGCNAPSTPACFCRTSMTAVRRRRTRIWAPTNSASRCRSTTGPGDLEGAPVSPTNGPGINAADPRRSRPDHSLPGKLRDLRQTRSG